MSAPLPGNPHFEDWTTIYEATDDAASIGSAILALAYEQRTANLIAMMRETYDRAGLRDKIADRLGWPEGGRKA